MGEEEIKNSATRNGASKVEKNADGQNFADADLINVEDFNAEVESSVVFEGNLNISQENIDASIVEEEVENNDNIDDGVLVGNNVDFSEGHELSDNQSNNNKNIGEEIVSDDLHGHDSLRNNFNNKKEISYGVGSADSNSQSGSEVKNNYAAGGVGFIDGDPKSSTNSDSSENKQKLPKLFGRKKSSQRHQINRRELPPMVRKIMHKIYLLWRNFIDRCRHSNNTLVKKIVSLVTVVICRFDFAVSWVIDIVRNMTSVVVIFGIAMVVIATICAFIPLNSKKKEIANKLQSLGLLNVDIKGLVYFNPVTFSFSVKDISFNTAAIKSSIDERCLQLMQFDVPMAYISFGGEVQIKSANINIIGNDFAFLSKLSSVGMPQKLTIDKASVTWSNCNLNASIDQIVEEMIFMPMQLRTLVWNGKEDGVDFSAIFDVDDQSFNIRYSSSNNFDKQDLDLQSQLLNFTYNFNRKDLKGRSGKAGDFSFNLISGDKVLDALHVGNRWNILSILHNSAIKSKGDITITNDDSVTINAKINTTYGDLILNSTMPFSGLSSVEISGDKLDMSKVSHSAFEYGEHNDELSAMLYGLLISRDHKFALKINDIDFGKIKLSNLGLHYAIINGTFDPSKISLALKIDDSTISTLPAYQGVKIGIEAKSGDSHSKFDYGSGIKRPPNTVLFVPLVAKGPNFSSFTRLLDVVFFHDAKIINYSNNDFVGFELNANMSLDYDASAYGIYGMKINIDNEPKTNISMSYAVDHEVVSGIVQDIKNVNLNISNAELSDFIDWQMLKSNIRLLINSGNQVSFLNYFTKQTSSVDNMNIRFGAYGCTWGDVPVKSIDISARLIDGAIDISRMSIDSDFAIGSGFAKIDCNLSDPILNMEIKADMFNLPLYDKIHPSDTSQDLVFGIERYVGSFGFPMLLYFMGGLKFNLDRLILSEGSSISNITMKASMIGGLMEIEGLRMRDSNGGAHFVAGICDFRTYNTSCELSGKFARLKAEAIVGLFNEKKAIKGFMDIDLGLAVSGADIPSMLNSARGRFAFRSDGLEVSGMGLKNLQHNLLTGVKVEDLGAIISGEDKSFGIGKIEKDLLIRNGIISGQNITFFGSGYSGMAQFALDLASGKISYFDVVFGVLAKKKNVPIVKSAKDAIMVSVGLSLAEKIANPAIRFLSSRLNDYNNYIAGINPELEAEAAKKLAFMVEYGKGEDGKNNNQISAGSDAKNSQGNDVVSGDNGDQKSVAVVASGSTIPNPESSGVIINQPGIGNIMISNPSSTNNISAIANK